MTDPLEILDAIDRERGESFIGMIQANQVRRLRDEIVALRKALHAEMMGRPDKWHAFIAEARAEALEEAAQACTDQTSDDPPPGAYNDACEDCAAAIRALKDKPAG